MGWDLSQYVSLINAPTADKPYHKTYTVKLLGNVVEGRPVKYLNLPVEDLKAAAIAQMQDGQPVWFGCDVGKCSLREGRRPGFGGHPGRGALRHGLYHGQSPAAGLRRKLDDPRHGVQGGGIWTEDGKPTRWRVENSWGKDAGENGYYVMSDAWFSEYTYQVVVNKKYLTAQQVEELSQVAHPAGALGPHGLPCLNALETINHRGDLCE